MHATVVRYGEVICDDDGVGEVEGSLLCGCVSVTTTTIHRDCPLVLQEKKRE